MTATEEKSDELDFESVGSDTDFSAMKEINEGSLRRESNSADFQEVVQKANSDEHFGGDINANGIRCSLITDAGLIKDVEIYDYEKRGMSLLILTLNETRPR